MGMNDIIFVGINFQSYTNIYLPLWELYPCLAISVMKKFPLNDEIKALVQHDAENYASFLSAKYATFALIQAGLPKLILIISLSILSSLGLVNLSFSTSLICIQNMNSLFIIIRNK